MRRYAKGDTKNVIAHQRRLAELRDVRRQRRSPIRASASVRPPTASICPVAPAATGGIQLTEAFGVPWCVQPQLESRTGRPACSGATPAFGMTAANAKRGSICAKGPMRSVRRQPPVRRSSKSADYTCNPDFNVSQLGVVTRWTPVKNLTFSAEVQWFHLDQKMSGQFACSGRAPLRSRRPLYEFKDQNTGVAAAPRPAQFLIAILRAMWLKSGCICTHRINGSASHPVFSIPLSCHECLQSAGDSSFEVCLLG